jgi:hypothetical protein
LCAHLAVCLDVSLKLQQLRVVVKLCHETLLLQVWADRYNKGSLHTDYQLHYKWPSKEAYTAAANIHTGTTAATADTATAPTAAAAATAAPAPAADSSESGDHRSGGDAPPHGESPVHNGQSNGQINGNVDNHTTQQQQQQQSADVRSNNAGVSGNNNMNSSVQHDGDNDSLDELYGNVNSAAGDTDDESEQLYGHVAATSVQGDTPLKGDAPSAVQLAAEHDRAALQFTQRARADHVRDLLRDVTYVSDHQVCSSCSFTTTI